MKRSVILALTLGLFVGSVATADAAKRKKKPVPVQFFFHGTEAVGEIDMVNNLSAFSYNKMDTTEPAADPAPKSMSWVDYVVGPNSNCAGNYLYPVWTGALTGRVVGDIKVVFHTVSAPRTVDVRVWPDIMSQACEGNGLAEGTYPVPAAEKSVTLPAGPGMVEVVLEDVNFEAAGSIMIQITPPAGEPLPGRVLYDSADYASSMQFSCIPTQGKSCTP